MAQAKTDGLISVAAWPLSPLYSRNTVVGLVMPRASEHKPIHELYTPKSRLREFPNANWRFLIHTASNVARAFAAVHSHGHVIGDVNHGNLLASGKALTFFIDCDSFQIAINGTTYRCEVGVSTYTPPELQGKTFSSILRTVNHDNFGLAVLIFHLLFMGRHPFAGRFSGRGDMPIERAIVEGRFAFGKDAPGRQMTPPPNSITLQHVSPDLAALFESAFSPAAANGSKRPDSQQWIRSLESFSGAVKQCSKNSVHHFYNQLKSCPWCEIEQNGALLFLQFTFVGGESRFDVSRWWSQVLAVPAPGPLPPLPAVHAGSGSPTAEAKQKGIVRRLSLGAITVLAIVILVGLFAASAPGAFFWAGMVIWAAITLGTKLNRARERYRAAWNLADAQYRSLLAKWETEASDSAFTAELRRLESLRRDYGELPNIRRQRLQQLEKDRFHAQLKRFLERYRLEDAKIPGIGAGRTAMLDSYGIDTADDIDWQSVQQVPGIGSTFASRLVDWRLSLERKFVYDATKGIDPRDIAQLDAEIAKRRIELEKGLQAGLASLRGTAAKVTASRKQLRSNLELALHRLQQTQSDYNAS
jgi:DNA-binding helix-hairpin-helix protein with protein kinase domain